MNEDQPVDQQLLQRLPLPLAQLCRRAQNAKTPLERHLAAYYLWECALKLLGATAVVAYAELDQHDAELTEKLKNLARPAVGHWWEFVRRLVPVMADKGDKGFATVRELALGRVRDDMPRAAGLYAALGEALEGKGGARTTVRLTELFDRLVTYRNREIGHGAAGQKPGEFYRRMGTTLLLGLTQVLEKLDVLAGRRMVYISDVRRVASGGWLIERYLLVSDSARRLEPLQLPEAERGLLPRPECVYLEGRRDPRVSVPFPTLRPLYPLVHYDPDSGKFYFLNSRRGKKQIEHLCYSTGEVLNKETVEMEQRELLAKILGRPVDSSSAADWATRSLADEPADAAVPDGQAPRAIGEFELLSRLGQGGMGVVYRAWQPSLGRQVALKCMLRSGDPKSEARFAREIRALGRIEHPNVVKVFTSGAEGDQWFYAMELVEGAELARVCEQLTGKSATEIDESRWHEALSTACERARSQEAPVSKTPSTRGGSTVTGGSTPPVAIPVAPSSTSRPALQTTGRGHVRQVVEIIRQVAGAVHALNEAGVVHRDIKPGNIMLTADGAHPVLMDLGLAQLADESDGRLTRTRQFVGTLRYASPEQVLSAGQVDRRTDVYSLGVTLWELLTLRPAFGADDNMPTPELMLKIQTTDLDSPRKFNKHVPRDLAAIVIKCLEKDRGRRYATAADLADDLNRFLKGEPVLAQPPSFRYLAGKFVRRYKVPLATAAGILLLAFVGVIVGFIKVAQERNQAVEAHEAAERSFAEARHAVDRFLNDVSEEHLKDIPGMQKLRQELIEKAVYHYEQFVKQRPDDDSVRAGLAKAYARLGTTIGQLGAADEAVAFLRQSLALRQELLDKEPDNPDYQNAVAECYQEMGYAYWEKHRYAEAAEPFQKALAIQEPLVKEHPDNELYQKNLGNLYNRLGDTTRAQAKDLDAAVANLEKSRAVFQSLVDRKPDNGDYLASLAAPIHNLALHYRDKGKYQQALELYDLSLELDARAIKASPRSNKIKSNHTVLLSNKARLLRQMGKIEEGATLYEDAIARAQVLVDNNPAVVRYLDLLAYYQKDVADFYRALNKIDEAVAAREKAAKNIEKLIAIDRKNADAWSNSLFNYNTLGEIESGRGRRENAKVYYEKAIAQARAVVDTFPEDIDIVYPLARANFLRGNLDFDGKEYASAAKFYDASLTTYEKRLLHLKMNNREGYLDEYVQTLSQAMNCAKNLKDNATVYRLADKALAANQADTSRRTKDRIAEIMLSVAGLRRELGQGKEAAVLCKQVIDLVKPLAEKDPWHYYLRSRMRAVYLELARVCKVLGDVPGEIEALRKHINEMTYLDGKDHTAELGLKNPLDAKEAERLRMVADRFVKRGMKRFTVPCSYNNGTAGPYHIYVCEAIPGQDPLADQVRVMLEDHGGRMSEQVRESFRKLHKIALENRVSFQELCVYALGAAADEETTKKQKETIKTLQANIANLKQQADKFPDRTETQVELGKAYQKLAMIHFDKKEYKQAIPDLERSRRIFEILIEKQPHSPHRDFLATLFTSLAKSYGDATVKEYDKALGVYLCALQMLEQLAESSSDAGYRRRQRQMEVDIGVLLQVSMKRPIEGARWYLKVMATGDKNTAKLQNPPPVAAARELASLYWYHPEVAPALPAEYRQTLARLRPGKKDIPEFTQAFLMDYLISLRTRAASTNQDEQFRQVLADLANRYHELARAQELAGKADERRRLLKKEFETRSRLLDLNPRDQKLKDIQAKLAAELGRSHLDAKQITDAVAWFQMAADLDDPESLLLLADWYDKGLYVKADAKKAGSHRYLGHALSGLRLFGEGRYQHALPHLQKAGESNLARAADHDRLGQCLGKLARWEEALAAYRRAFDMEPNSPTGSGVVLNLLEAYVVSDRWQEGKGFVQELAGKKWQSNYYADQRDGWQALFAGLSALMLHGLGENAGPQEQDMRKYLAKPGALNLNWNWFEIERWLATTTRLPADRKLAIVRIVAELQGAPLLDEKSAVAGISGSLTRDDPQDATTPTVGSFRKVHAMHLKAGSAYQIDLTGNFDTFLRVEDAQQKPLILNDDVNLSAGNLNSRVVFTPGKDDVYRIVVTTYSKGITGSYTLKVKPVDKSGAAEIGTGELTDKDEKYLGRFSRVHKVELVAGKPYTIELDSDRFDTYVVLYDAARKNQIAAHQSRPNEHRARIDVTPSVTATYVIVVTSADAGATGAYSLRVQGYAPK